MTNAYTHIATYRSFQAAIQLQNAAREAMAAVDCGGEQDNPLYIATQAAYDAACMALGAAIAARDADQEYQAELDAAGDWLATLI